MARSSRWLEALIPLAIIFAIVAIVAGFWMYTPIVLVAVLVLVILRLRHGTPPE